MSKITGILCQVITGNLDGAGTDGSIFLGLGGREFRMDSSADDYEKGSWREYVLGRGPVEPNLPPPQTRVLNPDKNDPRNLFPLDTTNLNRSPVYIRFESKGNSDNWNLRFAAALVYIGSGQFFSAFFPPSEFQNLWMGTSFGKILYLTQELRENENAVVAIGRELAAKR